MPDNTPTPTETIDLTDGQLQVLLNLTGEPEHYTPMTRSLVGALHRVKRHGHKWLTEMTEEDIETALFLFNAYQLDTRSPSARLFIRFFVSGNATAQRIYAEQYKSDDDVSRETTPEG